MSMFRDTDSPFDKTPETPSNGLHNALKEAAPAFGAMFARASAADAATSPSTANSTPTQGGQFVRVSYPTTDAPMTDASSTPAPYVTAVTRGSKSPIKLTNNFSLHAAAPPALSLGQTTNSQASPSENTPRAPSPDKQGRDITQPKSPSKRAKDMLTQQPNSFGALNIPEPPLSSSSTSTLFAPSPLVSQPQSSSASTTNAPATSALFGSLTNNNGHGRDSPSRSSSQSTKGQDVRNVYKPSVLNQGTSSQSGSSMILAQSQATKNGPPSSPFKPTAAKRTTKSKESSSSQESELTLAQDIEASTALCRAALNASKVAKGVEFSINPEHERLFGKLIPANFSPQAKKEMVTGLRFKQLDSGMAVRLHQLGGLEGMGMEIYNTLVRFYHEQKQAIIDADGGWMESAQERIARQAALKRTVNGKPDRDEDQESNIAGKRTEIGKRAPGMHRMGSKNKRNAGDESGRDQDQGSTDNGKRSDTGEPALGDHNSLSKNKRKADDESGRDQDQGLSDNGKRARLADGEQISYPSLPTGSNSNTSSMFKGILEKPTGRPSTKSNNTATPSSSNPPPLSNAPLFKPPIFGTGTPVNFAAKFADTVAQSEMDAKKKRKAEEFNSDDSDADEAEWERNDAEEQRAKKQKIQEDLREAAKAKPKFVPGKGIVTEAAELKDEANAAAPGTQAGNSHVTELDKKHAMAVEQAEKYRVGAAKIQGLFQSFDKVGSGNEGSKNGDADDEDDEEDGSDGDEGQQSKQVSKGSLFDRVSFAKPTTPKPADKEHPLGASSLGLNMFGHISGPAAAVGFNPINKSSPAKSPNRPGSGEKGDNTWKPESPIRFGGPFGGDGANDDAPAVNITSPSPSKAPLGSLFGSSKTANATVETPAKPALNFAAATPAGSLGSSFGFGISPLKPATSSTSSLFPPSTNPSNGVSRSTSPGATTGESAAESTADGEDEGAEKHEQLNLISGGPGEEDEDVLHEVRAKASIWNEGKGDEEKGEWETKGLGPFRILKNRETGKTRMLMRQDPSGRVIINASIFKHFEYKAVNKSTFRVPIPSASGKLETWIIKVGKDADAGAITKVLEENKDSN